MKRKISLLLCCIMSFSVFASPSFAKVRYKTIALDDISCKVSKNYKFSGSDDEENTLTKYYNTKYPVPFRFLSISATDTSSTPISHYILQGLANFTKESDKTTNFRIVSKGYIQGYPYLRFRYTDTVKNKTYKNDRILIGKNLTYYDIHLSAFTSNIRRELTRIIKSINFL